MTDEVKERWDALSEKLEDPGAKNDDVLDAAAHLCGALQLQQTQEAAREPLQAHEISNAFEKKYGQKRKDGSTIKINNQTYVFDGAWFLSTRDQDRAETELAAMKKSAVLTFHCPKCGGSHYGSAMWNGVLTRLCHSCRVSTAFSWPHTDDHKYFRWAISLPYEAIPEGSGIVTTKDEILKGGTDG